MKNDIFKLYKAGFNLVPIADKTKRPGVPTWKQWTSQKQNESDIKKLFATNYYGVGLICGRVSGIEVLDIDCKYDLTGTLFEDLLAIVFGRNNNLIKKVACQKTVSGGYHLIFKCSLIAGNQKLASRAATKEELSKNQNRKQYEIIETRGEGGYICCAPTPGYEFVTEQCGFVFSEIFDLQEITPEERVVLITSAKSLNQINTAAIAEVKNESDSAPKSEWIISPLDDYNNRVSDQEIISLLEKHKWSITKKTSKIIHLARPDKRNGTSATYGYHNKCFYVFTCSDSVFAGSRGYTPCQVLALLEYNGDFSKTAKDLMNKGYGKKVEITIPQKSTVPDSLEKPKINLTTETGDFQIGESIIADFVVSKLEKSFCYNPDSKKFMFYKDGRYETDLIGKMFCIVKKYSMDLRVLIQENYPYLEYKTKAAIDKKFTQFLNANKIKGVLEILKNEPQISVRESRFDKDAHLFNCKNGTINLKTGEFFHHSPDYLLSKISGTKYDPEATCPKWEKFLTEIIPDSEIRNYLQVLVGYSLTGDVSGQALIIAHGTGANGKSVFVHVMEQLSGEYFKTLQPDILLYKYGASQGGATPEIAKLRGARFAVSPEVPDGRLDESLVKYLTGSDIITARHLYAESFEFKPSHKIWLTSNYLPTIRGSDYGIWRRIHVIPFNVQIPEEKRRPFSELCNDLSTELPGILNWAIAGAEQYYCEDLRQPEVIRAAREDYKKSVDMVQSFVEECCNVGKTGSVQVKELYNVYAKWTHENGEYQLKSKDFNKNLELKGFQKKKSTGGYFYFFGISLKEEF